MWLVRHARPQVATGVCYGAMDVMADPKATQMAAQTLANTLPQGLTLLTSPLQRCELLALVLCGLRHDLSYKSDARLREMDFGQWEGVRWDAIPAAAFSTWIADFWQHRFGGAECVADVMARVASVWDEADRANQDQVWITHAGVIRAASLIAGGVRAVKDARQWPSNAPDYGQWITLAKDADPRITFMP
jgi:alpha-ribazole phosphatase